MDDELALTGIIVNINDNSVYGISKILCLIKKLFDPNKELFLMNKKVYVANLFDTSKKLFERNNWFYLTNKKLFVLNN